MACHLNIKFQTLYLPNQKHWWKLDTLGGVSVNKAVPTTEGFKVRNKNFRTMRIKNRIFVVFSCIYRQKHSPRVESDYSRHPQNSSCSTETAWLWTYVVDWQFLQESRISKEVKDRTDCGGTLKLNRENVPKEVKDKKLEKGEITARHLGPVTVLKWRDKRNVTMVSTYRSADTQKVSNKGKETEKPLCMIDYSYNMGGSWFEGPVAAHVHGWEEKKWPNDTSNFSKG